MRFPSLIRLPKHQQFEIKPRYYDPVSEEVQERTKRLRELAEDGEEGTRKRISFQRQAKSSFSINTSLVQLGIAILLVLALLGWLQYGNQVFYYMGWAALPVYLFFRLRGIAKRRRNE